MTSSDRTSGTTHDVAGIEGDVRNEHDLLVKRRVADEAAAHLHPRQLDLLAVAHRGLDLELLRILVEQDDAERPVVDEPAREAGNARQQLVEIEDGGELAADLGQRLERARVVPLVLEQPGVLDRDGDVRGKLAEDRFVGLRELADRVAEQIQRADHAALAAQRHDQLGVRAGHGFDVARIGVHVVDQDRLPFAPPPPRPGPLRPSPAACARHRRDSRRNTRSSGPRPSGSSK